MAGRIRKIYKTFFDVPTWLGAQDIAATTKKLTGRVESIFVVPIAQHSESFEEALQRLHLTRQDLEQRVEEFTRLLFFYFAMTVGFYVYWIYLIWERHFLSAMVVTAVLGLLFSQIFRYHFWLFQIQQQKLGATFLEWVRHCMGKRK